MFDEKKNPPPRGLADRVIRRFRFLAWILSVLTLYLIGATAVGVALAPGLWVGSWLVELGLGVSHVGRWLVMGMGIAAGAAVSSFALIVVVPVYNFLLPTRIKRFKGGYYTIASLGWFIHNALFFLVRYTVLPFFTLSPFGVWFLRAMGMKIGKRVFVNTENISDPRLITLGDDVVIGGSASIFAHYGGGGHLVLAPVEIGDRATIGLKASIMGDVIVGEEALIMPHTVLLPGTRVGRGETWSGVPGRPVSAEETERNKASMRGLALRRVTSGSR